MILCIFVVISCCFLFLSWHTYHASKPVNLWANDTKRIKVKDIRKYNQSCSRLLCGYAVILIMTGMIVQTQDTLMIVIGMLLIVFSTLLLMILYAQLEGKYRL